LWFEYARKKRKNKYISTGRGYDATKQRLESRVVEKPIAS
jgi:hypothetical protein